jgi:hypothetical protein
LTTELQKYNNVIVGAGNSVGGNKNIIIGDNNKVDGNENWVFVSEYKSNGPMNGNLLVGKWRV